MILLTTVIIQVYDENKKINPVTTTLPRIFCPNNLLHTQRYWSLSCV